MGLVGFTASRATSWKQRLDWYLDPAGTHGGNDWNEGSATAPLRTWRELKKRVGQPWEPPGVGRIFVMSDCAESMGFEIVGHAPREDDFSDPHDGTIIGVSTVVDTVTLTSSSTTIASPSTYSTITVAGKDWTPHIGRRIRVKDSPDGWLPGTFAFIRADLGSGVALVTPWVDGGGQATSPASGTVCEIYTVPTVSGQWGITVNSAIHYVAVDLDIGGNAGLSGIYVTAGYGAQAHAVQVLSNGYTLEAQQGSNLELYGCFAAGGHIRSQGGHLVCWGGGATGNGSRLYALGGFVEIMGAMMLESGAFLDVQGGATMLVNATVGLRNSSTHGIVATRGSIQLSGQVFATGMTAAYGLEVEAGQEILCASGRLPVLATPATAFAKIGSETRSAAQLAAPYLSTNGALFAYKVL